MNPEQFIKEKRRNPERYTTFHRISRQVMEKHLGRKLKSTEIIHHIDSNQENNNIDNLYLFPSKSKHHKHHLFLRRIVKNLVDGLTQKQRTKQKLKQNYLDDKQGYSNRNQKQKKRILVNTTIPIEDDFGLIYRLFVKLNEDISENFYFQSRGEIYE